MDIRKLRLASKIKQSDLAKTVNVDISTLKRWERGLEIPEDCFLSHLADVFQTDFLALKRNQQKLVKTAIPGEGYTTLTSNQESVFPRKNEPPSSARLVLDLFCGAGGLSYGFEQSGEFLTSCGIDLLNDRIDTFVSNHHYAVGISGDICKLPLTELKKHCGDVDVVVGGPPCQGFSSIRPFRTLTEGDPRNSLVEQYALIIKHLQPRWFVFENVVGLLTHEGGKRLESLVNNLSNLGYTTDWRILNTALFGIPQVRERIVLVGNREGIEFHWPQPTNQHEYKSMAGLESRVLRSDPIFSIGIPPAITLEDAIGDLPPVEAGQEATSYGKISRLNEYQKLMRDGCQDLTLHKATSHSKKMLNIIRHAGYNINALPKGLVKSGFSSCYSRLHADRPSTTLTVNFVHPASNRCIHPSQNRALTPREGARIQSFPDKYVFKGNMSQIVKQIGNAVPPLLGKVIANAIIESEHLHLKKSKKKKTLVKPISVECYA